MAPSITFKWTTPQIVCGNFEINLPAFGISLISCGEEYISLVLEEGFTPSEAYEGLGYSFVTWIG